MKWKTAEYVGPKEGDKRIRKEFLLFPKTIKGVGRWLETATWEEEYGFGWGDWEFGEDDHWRAVRWVD